MLWRASVMAILGYARVSIHGQVLHVTCAYRIWLELEGDSDAYRPSRQS